MAQRESDKGRWQCKKWTAACFTYCDMIIQTKCIRGVKCKEM